MLSWVIQARASFLFFLFFLLNYVISSPEGAMSRYLCDREAQVKMSLSVSNQHQILHTCYRGAWHQANRFKRSVATYLSHILVFRETLVCKMMVRELQWSEASRNIYGAFGPTFAASRFIHLVQCIEDRPIDMIFQPLSRM